MLRRHVLSASRSRRQARLQQARKKYHAYAANSECWVTPSYPIVAHVTRLRQVRAARKRDLSALYSKELTEKWDWAVRAAGSHGFFDYGPVVLSV